jgi:hypothetical protein
MQEKTGKTGLPSTASLTVPSTKPKKSKKNFKILKKS